MKYEIFAKKELVTDANVFISSTIYFFFQAGNADVEAGLVLYELKHYMY